MSANTTVADSGPDQSLHPPHTVLFPDVRLDEVLRFDDELLLALRSTKSWQDPASPAWLGSALCALATAIGPMVRLILPDGWTVTPNFNAFIAIPSRGSLQLNCRLLAPIANIQSSVGRNDDFTLKYILTPSFKGQELRYLFPRALNGGLVIADEDTALLQRFLEAEETDQDYVANALGSYLAPKEVDALTQPTWEGSFNLLMFGRREQMPELAATPLFQSEIYPNLLVLPEEFVPYDVSSGHEFGFIERKPWNDLIKRVTGFPNFWSLQGKRKVNCSEESAASVESFRKELEDVLKAIDPAYHPFVSWLPDLAAKIAVTICFAQNPEASFIGSRVVQHAVAITKWLGNCHFKGMQEILQVEPVPDVSDQPAIPDKPRLILEKLRIKGPMKPREISRSCYQMTASARDHALNWLRERNFVVFRPDGKVQAVT
jgi:hypothetical protein